MGDKLLTAAQLAEELQVKPQSVLLWARIGRVPSVKINRRIIGFDVKVVLRALGASVTA